MENGYGKVYLIPNNGKYIIDMKKYYITALAKESGEDAKIILHRLICFQDINIFNCFEQHVLNMNIECKSFADLPLCSDILYQIYSKGSWTGNTFKMPIVTEQLGNELIDAYANVSLNSNITISIEDLFVLEDGLVAFKNEHTDTLDEKPAISNREENSLYALIGVFLDMMVDKKGENHLPNPNDDKKYPFQNQASLINHIEKYEVFGLKKSSLEEKFSKANSTINSKF